MSDYDEDFWGRRREGEPKRKLHMELECKKDLPNPFFFNT